MNIRFYVAVLVLLAFELANVYFIMPLPGSQQADTVALAYLLHTARWVIRGLLLLAILLTARAAFRRNRWLPALALLPLLGIGYATHYEMAADTMFYQPSVVSVNALPANAVDTSRLVLGVAHNGEARAYPIQFLGYHHQVRDTIGGKPIMVTYCTVCRTGRVFEPVVNGEPDQFRLVGMDRFNAMFEDRRTGSWWRQATGEAVAGPCAGQTLPEFPSMQATLSTWIALYPDTRVMQPDPKFQAEYDDMATYEGGRLTGKLTRRDTAAWQEKSWVVGVHVSGAQKAYDWNELARRRLIYDEIDGTPIAVVLAADGRSFAALQRTGSEQTFVLQGDTLLSEGKSYDLLGRALTAGAADLNRLNAYQEYWHSWRTFHQPAQQRGGWSDLDD